MSDKKPFPIPPFTQSRGSQSTSSSVPFGPPTPDHINTAYDDDIKNDDIQLLFTSYLRPDQKRLDIYRFILGIVTHRNTAQAAREAGLSYGSGTYWRQKPEIHKCIEAITQRSVLKYGYDAEEVIERAKEAMNFDPVVLQNPDGSYKKNLHDLPPDARRNIKKLKVKNIYEKDENGMPTVTGEIVEYEFYDKQRAIEQLGPEKNVIKKTTVVQHDVTNNMKDVLLESGNRAEERLRLLNAREVVDAEAESGGGEESGGDGNGVPVGEAGGDSPGN